MLRSVLRLCLLCTAVLLLSGCSALSAPPIYDGADLHIVTTVFPPYDFARNVTRGNSAVCVQQLLPPGTESHTFDPTPADILAVRNCDVFIYTGGESDAWVETLLSSADNDGVRIIRMMDCVDAVEETVVAGMTHRHDHDHEHASDSDHIEYDEHVWTDPHNAILITDEIARILCDADPQNAALYRDNAAAYTAELTALDETFHDIAAHAVRHTVVFGDRFPFRYLCDAYGISYRAAFPGCAAESEPSARTALPLYSSIWRITSSSRQGKRAYNCQEAQTSPQR